MFCGEPLTSIFTRNEMKNTFLTRMGKYRQQRRRLRQRCTHSLPDPRFGMLKNFPQKIRIGGAADIALQKNRPK